jgi:DNA invertase Pin-like site-specific DNA recombinase
LVEFFPHDDDGKGEQHRVEHTNRGKLKAGNLIIGAQVIDLDVTAYDDRARHREQGCRDDKDDGGKPQGQGRRERSTHRTKPIARQRKSVEAVAYLRTSSATNTGPDKDSDKRQRTAISAFAKAHGADPIAERPGFKAMLDRIAGNGVRCILVESPDRFARDLTVQLTGHDFLKSLGISLIPATAPDFFTEDTPTAVLVRQVLGAIAQFEKTSLVAKLKAARDRKKAATGKCGGRKSYREARPEVVTLAKELRGRRMSLRKISAELAGRGYTTASGKPYVASAVQAMLG